MLAGGGGHGQHRLGARQCDHPLQVLGHALRCGFDGKPSEQPDKTNVASFKELRLTVAPAPTGNAEDGADPVHQLAAVRNARCRAVSAKGLNLASIRSGDSRRRRLKRSGEKVSHDPSLLGHSIAKKPEQDARPVIGLASRQVALTTRGASTDAPLRESASRSRR